MKIAITATAQGSRFSPIILTGDYEAQIKKASELGFQAIELHVRDPHAIDRGGLLQTARQTGMEIVAIGTGQAYVDEGLSFTASDPVLFQRAIQRVRDQIDLGRFWGARVILGTIRGRLPLDRREAGRAREQMAAALRECARYAAEQGVLLTLEAINRYEMNFLNTAGEVLAFLDEIGEPALGAHLDTFHMNIEEVSALDAIRRAGARLVHLHFADSNRLAPGWGHLDFSSIVHVLYEIGYDGAISLECLPRPDPVSAARQGRRYLEALLASRGAAV